MVMGRKGAQSMKRQNEDAPLINKHIRAQRIQLITHEGQNVGAVTRDQALQLAEAVGLDLVLLSESGDTPVCKIMDYGKVLYERKKKQAESKKKQKIIQIKEVKFRPKIGEHDYETKIKRAVQFLKDGKRVKITLTFRGRENINKEQRGNEIFSRISASFVAYNVDGLAHERDSRMGRLWSRVYYVK